MALDAKWVRLGENITRDDNGGLVQTKGTDGGDGFLERDKVAVGPVLADKSFDLAHAPIKGNASLLYIQDVNGYMAGPFEYGRHFTIVHNLVGGKKSRVVFDSSAVVGSSVIPDGNDAKPTTGLQDKLEAGEHFILFYTR